MTCNKIFSINMYLFCSWIKQADLALYVISLRSKPLIKSLLKACNYFGCFNPPNGHQPGYCLSDILLYSVTKERIVIVNLMWIMRRNKCLINQ